MKKFFTYLLVLGTSLSTLAADPVRGLFASVHVGGQGTYENHTYTNPAGADGKEEKLNISAVYGINFGILNQIEKTKAVVGGEVFLNMSSATQKYVLRAANGPSEGNVQIKNPLNFGPTGILGTMITPKLMLYAKAGFAWNSFQLKYSNLNNNERPNSKTYKKFLRGPVAGAGANYLLTNKIMIGGEYMYFHPSEITPRKLSNPEGGVARQYKFGPTMHQVVVKLSMLF